MLALAVMLFGYSATAQNTNKLLETYIPVKDALVSGDGKAASEAIGTFYKAVKNEGDFAQKSELLKASEKLNKAGNNIEAQRAALHDVSTVLWKIVKKADKLKSPVYYQYCPMKKSNWISTEKDVKNPYYGSAMLTCGKVIETKG